MIEEVKALRDMPIAGVDLTSKETGELIDLAIAKKQKADYAKAELDVINAEIQERAIRFQEERHIKFTEWRGFGHSLASVTVARSFDVLNIFKLKELIGKELVEEKVRLKPADVKYEIDTNFKKALTALMLEDYEPEVDISQVIDGAGWCEGEPAKKTLLLNKLKGDYKRDKKSVLDVLNLGEDEIDIDAELFVIYQIKNWELILAYFNPEDLETVKAALKRCVMVDETAKISLQAV